MTPDKLPVLLPCPFCGERADTMRSPGILGPTNKWTAFCTGQDCSISVEGPTLARVVETWNRRTPEAGREEQGWAWEDGETNWLTTLVVDGETVNITETSAANKPMQVDEGGRWVRVAIRRVES